MLDGKYWGNYKQIDEEIYDEDFFADFDEKDTTKPFFFSLVRFFIVG